MAIFEARPDAWGGVGVFATQRIPKGQVVESGVVQRLPVDGNACPYVFTWSEADGSWEWITMHFKVSFSDEPPSNHGRRAQDRSVWATGSGCSVFYNASLDGSLGRIGNPSFRLETTSCTDSLFKHDKKDGKINFGGTGGPGEKHAGEVGEYLNDTKLR